MSKLLIDGDILVYRCGFAAEKDKGGLFAACYNVRSQIEKMVNANGICKYQVFITGKGNFREKVATILPYKGNRAKARKPKFYDDLREYLEAEWNAIVVHDMEADDAMGIEQTKLNGEGIICSIDKDLDMIPGWHFNFVKRNKYYIDELEAYRKFYQQILTGDDCDHIPGLYGIGKVKAAKSLEKCKSKEEMEKAIYDLYSQQVIDGKIKLKGSTVEITEDRTLDNIINEIKNLLWIRRE